MSEPVSWIDRIRIEGFVWSLDQRMYELPRQARIAHRREVRENLREAAGDVGVGTAMARLGGPRRLAAEYLVAEYGDEARPHWLAAAVVLCTAVLLVFSLLTSAATAFGDGLTKATPHLTGRFTWGGIDLVQSKVTYVVTDGHVSMTGGALSPFGWAVLLVATVVAGRLWYVIPRLRRR